MCTKHGGFAVCQVLYIEERDKFEALCDMVSAHPGLTLVFVETKRNADMLEHKLCGEGYPATSIHGDRTQQEREAALRTCKCTANTRARTRTNCKTDMTRQQPAASRRSLPAYGW